MTAQDALRGRYIVIEGLDGVGSTTQTRRLAGWVQRNGLTDLAIREPSDNPVGQLIRRFLRHEFAMPPAAVALAFAADRLLLHETVIAPALAKGNVVISDRSVLSSLAYQAFENDVTWIEAINRTMPRADLTLLLDAPVSVCLERLAKRGGVPDRYEQEETLKAVRAAYYRAVDGERLAGHRVGVIDGALDEDSVATAIQERVLRELSRPR